MAKLTKAQLVEKYVSMMEFENKAWKNGYKLVAGIDEAGRGPLAGPVVAAACILDPKELILALMIQRNFPRRKGKNCSKS